MATTTESIRLREFEDPDFQRLYELLKNTVEQADNKSKAVMLRSLAKQLEELATQLNPA
jgi:hypothetical protein